MNTPTPLFICGMPRSLPGKPTLPSVRDGRRGFASVCLYGQAGALDRADAGTTGDDISPWTDKLNGLYGDGRPANSARSLIHRSCLEYSPDAGRFQWSTLDRGLSRRVALRVSRREDRAYTGRVGFLPHLANAPRGENPQPAISINTPSTSTDTYREAASSVLALPIADRHYNRQKIGTPQFVPPGRCLVLVHPAETQPTALWVSSWPFTEYTKHAWAGAWVNTLFRREESEHDASAMILDAVSATRAHWGDPPDLGMVTFIDPNAVKPIKKRSRPMWGWSYFKAGFKHVGYTGQGLWAMQLAPEDMPESRPAIGTQSPLLTTGSH